MRKNKFQLKREETYERLIQVGMSILCERGYSSTTIDDITKAAGYTKGAFYVHFKNKEDFFFHLLDQRSTLRKAWPAAKRESEDMGFEQTLRATVKQRIEVLQEYLSYGAGWALVYIEYFLLFKENEQVQERYSEMLKQWLTEIEGFVESLKDRGWVAPEIDTAVAARQIYAQLDGMILHQNLYQMPFDAEKITDVILRLLQN